MFSFYKKSIKLSVIVVVYKMADQAERTIRSLCAPYQQGADAAEYEVIVVENRSDWLLGGQRAQQCGQNVRYFLRDEAVRTPVHAIHFGVSQARGSHVAIMIDGARMLTPGVIRLTLDAFGIAPQAAVATPCYHIGEKLQQVAVNEGYNEQVEATFFERIQWPIDGYRLFEIAVLSGSWQRGFFQPNYESNFIATSLKKWRVLNGMDQRYNDFGGGNANLDFYKRLLELPNTPLYMLFGEGAFHQFHGGVTTGRLKEERAALYKQLDDQDIALRGENRAAPEVPPIFFGTLHPSTYRFLQQSLQKVPVQ